MLNQQNKIDQTTIEARQQKDKENLLEQLKKFPVIQISCLKAGVSRSSFYRWKESDKEFAVAVEKAMEEGINSINDLSETRLIEMIQNRNFSAIYLWLRTHSAKYANKVEITHVKDDDEELSPEQAVIVKEALRLAAFDKTYGKEK